MIHVEFDHQWGHLKKYCPPMRQLWLSEDLRLDLFLVEFIYINSWKNKRRSVRQLQTSYVIPLECFCEVCIKWTKFRNEYSMLKLVTSGIIWKNPCWCWSPIRLIEEICSYNEADVSLIGYPYNFLIWSLSVMGW